MKFVEQVTKAKNIKANLPKVLKPTWFLCMKDIKTDSFLITTDINANLLKLENKAENVDKYKGQLGFKWGTRPSNSFLDNQTLPDLPASFCS